MMKKYLVWMTIGITILLPFDSFSQAQASADGNITVITNPTFFVLGGYHIKPSYHFPKRWSLGATWQGGFELPDFARDQFFNHDNDDLVVNWDYAIGLELKYRFTDATYDKGFFASFNLGYEGWAVEEDDRDEFDNWFASLDFGYNWYSFKKQRLHFGLQYTLIFILNNTSDRTVGETTYNIKNVVPPSFLPAIFIGWRFSK